jgi:hypothetical protein
METIMPTPTKPRTQGKRLSLLSFGLFEEHLLPVLLACCSSVRLVGGAPAAKRLASLQQLLSLSGVSHEARALVHRLALEQLELALKTLCGPDTLAALPAGAARFHQVAGLLHARLVFELQKERSVLVLRWHECNDENDSEQEHSATLGNPSEECIFIEDDMLEFVEGCSEGECGEQSFSVELLNDKQERPLAKVDMLSWGRVVNLMQFNMLSSGHADFARILWTAAGRPSAEYSDMAIEFGTSPHSGESINRLIAAAMGGDFEEMISCDTLYLNTERAQRMRESPGKPKDVQVLLAKVAERFETSYMVGHTTDLPDGLSFDDLCGWHCLSPQQPGAAWYVRLPEEYMRS